MDGFDALSLPKYLATHIRREIAFRTDIVVTASGSEHRNAGWAQGRRRFILDTGPVSLKAAREVEIFFEARRGRHRGFLLRDWLRPHSGTGLAPSASDVTLSVADMTRRNYLIRPAGRSNIMPRKEGFLLAVDRRRLSQDGFTLDEYNAQVRMAKAVPRDAVVTAGFYFDVPVRFDVDRLELERVAKDMVRLAPVPIIEINLPR